MTVENDEDVYLAIARDLWKVTSDFHYKWGVKPNVLICPLLTSPVRSIKRFCSAYGFVSVYADVPSFSAAVT